MCPIVTLAYISMSVKIPEDSQTSNSTNNAIEVLGTTRSFRWVSVHTCALEVDAP